MKQVKLLSSLRHLVPPREFTAFPGHTVSKVGLFSSLAHGAHQCHFGRACISLADKYTFIGSTSNIFLLHIFDLNGSEAALPSPYPSGSIWKATVDMDTVS